MRAKWNSSAHLSQYMYPPQLQKNFFAWLLLVDLEEWKRNRYKTEKTGSKHIWSEIPSKPNFLLLKQQKLLSVLQFYTKTEYKPQLLLNKKLFKQLYTTLSVPRIVNGAKIKSRDKNPKRTKCLTLLNSFWKTPQWWPLQALLHWKKFITELAIKVELHWGHYFFSAVKWLH